MTVTHPEFDCPTATLTFSDFHGRRLVERLPLAPGVRVLNAYCGDGAAAMVAADAVAPAGRVIVVDPEDRLLERAARAALRAGHHNVEWHAGSPERLPFGDATFDAVFSAFGLFLAEDATEMLKSMWRVLRRGGTLAVATWAAGSFEPANSALCEAVRRVRPTLARAEAPWGATGSVDALQDVLARAGIHDARLETVTCEHPLRTSLDWSILAGAPGYREVLDELGPLERDLVEIMTMRPLLASGVSTIGTHAIHAVVTRR